MAKYRAKAKAGSVKPRKRQPAQGRSLEDMLRELLDEKQHPSGANPSLSISVRECLLRITIAKALGGDVLCLNKLLDLMKNHDTGTSNDVVPKNTVSREEMLRIFPHFTNLEEHREPFKTDVLRRLRESE